MNILKFGAVLIAITALTACGGGKNTQPETYVTAPNSGKVISVNVQRSSGIVNSGTLDQNALAECPLLTQFPELLIKHGADNGVTVNLVSKLDTKAPGYQLEANYTQIQSAGNAFIGHRKFTKVHLTLFKDGKKVAEADAGRWSGGGAFGGFKGSCSVLGRTVDANASDTAKWLVAPADGARLGDM